MAQNPRNPFSPPPGPVTGRALEHRPAPPVYRPGVAAPQMKPAVNQLALEHRPAPPVYRSVVPSGGNTWSSVALQRWKAPTAGVPLRVVQRAVGGLAAGPAPAPALNPAAVLAIRARIAAAQGRVDANRGTINLYTARNILIPGLRHGQLEALIAALNASIAARQEVVDEHARLGEGDQGHPARVAIEQGILAAAEADLATLAHHAAGPWTADPVNAGREFRILARWDRDPQVREQRDIDPGGGEPFQVVHRGRRGGGAANARAGAAAIRARGRGRGRGRGGP